MPDFTSISAGATVIWLTSSIHPFDRSAIAHAGKSHKVLKVIREKR